MAERWRYVDEEMPPLNETVLVIVERDSPFGRGLDSYLDSYREVTGWGRTIEVWGKASKEGHTVLAWLPIPPFERKENPIEAFVRKQPCDKCLFQNTPNCKIFGIGVNGEMGCSFKERVRMSEIEEN